VILLKSKSNTMSGKFEFFLHGHTFSPASHFKFPSDMDRHDDVGCDGPNEWNAFGRTLCRDGYRAEVKSRESGLTLVELLTKQQRDGVRESGSEFFPKGVSDLISCYALDPDLVKLTLPVPECPKCAAELRWIDEWRQAAEEKN